MWVTLSWLQQSQVWELIWIFLFALLIVPLSNAQNRSFEIVKVSVVATMVHLIRQCGRAVDKDFGRGWGGGCR